MKAERDAEREARRAFEAKKRAAFEAKRAEVATDLAAAESEAAAAAAKFMEAEAEAEREAQAEKGKEKEKGTGSTTKRATRFALPARPTLKMPALPKRSTQSAGSKADADADDGGGGGGGDDGGGGGGGGLAEDTEESVRLTDEEWIAMEMERMTMPDWDGFVKEEYILKEG